jgi:hypothetical protein
MVIPWARQPVLQPQVKADSRHDEDDVGLAFSHDVCRMAEWYRNRVTEQQTIQRRGRRDKPIVNATSTK